MKETFVVEGKLAAICKYGENAWQPDAGLYVVDRDDPLSLGAFKVIEGSEPSYNNICDLDRLLQTVTHIAAAWLEEKPALAGGVKHGNPCGAAVGKASSPEVVTKMMAGDGRAIFGGSVIMNFPCTADVADRLLIGGRPALDTIIAPEIDKKAIEWLARKGGKCRFMVNPALADLSAESLDKKPRFRYVRGGALVQPNYDFVLSFDHPDLKVYGKRSESYENDLRLAWAVGSTSNSNTVTLVKDRMLIGNGVGQQDRVGAAELAIKRARDAGHSAVGAVAYSDSFFPFADGPAALIASGIRAIFSTSGSVNDAKIQALCQAADVTLYQLPDKAARGFFGH
jgi:phosphoribosylaminoimidazolecarboxamide formyltransferase/IMP cyclohydrolase